MWWKEICPTIFHQGNYKLHIIFMAKHHIQSLSGLLLYSEQLSNDKLVNFGQKNESEIADRWSRANNVLSQRASCQLKLWSKTYNQKTVHKFLKRHKHPREGVQCSGFFCCQVLKIWNFQKCLKVSESHCQGPVNEWAGRALRHWCIMGEFLNPRWQSSTN